MEAVSQDIEEHWLDGDYLNRSDVCLALREALNYCAKKQIDPPFEAIAVVGRFYHLQNLEREEGGKD
jgi:hypothetical protein